MAFHPDPHHHHAMLQDDDVDWPGMPVLQEEVYPSISLVAANRLTKLSDAVFKWHFQFNGARVTSEVFKLPFEPNGSDDNFELVFEPTTVYLKCSKPGVLDNSKPFSVRIKAVAEAPELVLTRPKPFKADHRTVLGFKNFVTQPLLANKWIQSNGTIRMRIDFKPAEVDTSWEEHFARLANGFEEELGADFTIKTSDGRFFKASKTILMTQSKYFRALIENPMKEGLSSETSFENLEYEPLRVMVKFMYSQKVDLKTVDFALEVLVAADFCDMASLKAVCEKFITSKLVISNAFKVSDVARLHNSPGLVAESARLVGKLSDTDVAKMMAEYKN